MYALSVDKYVSHVWRILNCKFRNCQHWYFVNKFDFCLFKKDMCGFCRKMLGWLSYTRVFNCNRLEWPNETEQEKPPHLYEDGNVSAYIRRKIKFGHSLQIVISALFPIWEILTNAHWLGFWLTYFLYETKKYLPW